MKLDSLRNLFFLASLLLIPSVVDAQVALGSNCTTLTHLDGEQQSVVLDQSASAGQWIIVSVTVNNTFAQFTADNPISDSANNHYAAYGTVGLAQGTGFLATFAARATNAVNAGASIFINYATSGTALADSCAMATSFSGVLTLSDPSDVIDTASGSGSDWLLYSVAPTQYGSDLVYTVFSSADQSGDITVLPPARGLGQICSADSVICMLPAWNFGSRNAGNTESSEATSAISARWGALLVTFQSHELIFSDGFDF